jgi:hypothetical protein
MFKGRARGSTLHHRPQLGPGGDNPLGEKRLTDEMTKLFKDFPPGSAKKK